jgi:molybdopterin synthase catalytic subunit
VSDRLIKVTADPISAGDALTFVADPGAGGTCLFAGTVRDASDAGEVTGITYEAWDELAVARLNELADQLFGKWPVRRVAIVHRTGELGVGETSVIVATSAPHRDDAFEACRHAVDRLKEDIPVWKKEHLVSGDARWVQGS